MRYDQQTTEFWLTVSKLFKGRGINFFRRYKGESMGHNDQTITPAMCKINFAVPSDFMLRKFMSQYQIDVDTPGIIHVALDSLIETNCGKDVKLSMDGKGMIYSVDDNGEENLGGPEKSPTLQERRERFGSECDDVKTCQEIISSSSEDMTTELIHCSALTSGLLITLKHSSLRIRELREMIVKRQNTVEKLMAQVEGDWMRSKLAPSISFWQSKIYLAKETISGPLESNDKIAFAVACLNGTTEEYITGHTTHVSLSE